MLMEGEILFIYRARSGHTRAWVHSRAVSRKGGVELCVHLRMLVHVLLVMHMRVLSHLRTRVHLWVL